MFVVPCYSFSRSKNGYSLPKVCNRCAMNKEMGLQKISGALFDGFVIVFFFFLFKNTNSTH